MHAMKSGMPTGENQLSGIAHETWLTINWWYGRAKANECLASDRWSDMVEWVTDRVTPTEDDPNLYHVPDAEIFAFFHCLYGIPVRTMDEIMGDDDDDDA